MKKSDWAKGAAAGAGGLLLLVILIGLATIYAGGFNVAATAGHSPLTRWAFETSMTRAVQTRASRADAAPEFTPGMIESGAGHYKAMCQHCHGGPGVEPEGWTEGLLPRPPHLTEHASDWNPSEIHWLVTNGVKMTAMPAFGPSHGDAEIWSIAAFVSRLPAMTPETYAAYSEGHAEGDSHAGQSHAASHAETEAP